MNLAAIDWSNLARIASEQAGNCLAGGAVIFLLASFCSHLLRRESSSARFAVWFSGVLAIGGIPLFALMRLPGTSHVFSPGAGHAAAIVLPGAWALYLFFAWLIVACIALARIGVGFWQVYALRRRSAVLDVKELAPELQETLQRFQPGREVAILLSDEIQSPTAIGLLSPAIVLPRWLLRELSAGELRQVFLHELAHLRRWDDWSNLLQKVIKALFFFHPAVWWMERQISLEREMACDEAVLAQTDNPRAYAQCLVLLAEKSFFRRSVMLAQAAVSRVGQTSLRVARILRPGRLRTAGAGRLIAASFGVMMVVSLVALPHMPKLIAFESNQPQPASAQIASSSSATLSMSSRDTNTASDRTSTGLHAQPVAVARRHQGVLSSPDRMAPGLAASNVVAAKLGLARNRQHGVAMAQAPAAELVVIVVERRVDGAALPAMWQIQMWQFTVLRTRQNPVPQATPQKVI